MLDGPRLDLRIVAGDEVGEARQSILRPGATLTDRHGVIRRLPSYFYEVPSWEAARDIKLAPNFGLWELIEVDVREAEVLRPFPRYVPCAITVLAAHLQVLRSEIGRVVRIATNGGYRSPGHRLTRGLSPHCWASAANIYRIGDEWLDTRSRIERYAEIARRVLPGAATRSYGIHPGDAFDHLHIDLGYVTVEPGRGRPAQEETSREEE